MNHFKSTFRSYRDMMKGHPIATGVSLLMCLIILAYSWHAGTSTHTVAYLVGVLLCIMIVDLVVIAKPVVTTGFIIKQSVKKELFVIVSCTLLGLVFFCIRFFSDWQHMQGWMKLLALTLIVFAFPIALALIFLFVFKYKFKELGINLNYWYLPLLLHLVWGGISLSIVPEKSHFVEAAKEYGFFGFIFTGILGAALSEEFVRMLFLSRIGNALNNAFAGIFIASLIWCAMHIPVSYNQDPLNFSLETAVMGTINLMPLGLFWGYLTYRTQSLLPVVLMHGFNLWGLQNF